MLDAVTTLKAAGLQASVIIMLGVGGARYADGHVHDTVALLNAMPLGRGDLVYFSDFVAQPGAPYAALAAAAGIAPLEPAATAGAGGGDPRWLCGPRCAANAAVRAL